MGKTSCAACGNEYRYSVVDSYRYAESGLENVYLTNVEVVTCKCGESVVIRAQPTLLRILASCFAYKPARIRGPEVRFVRNVLGKKSKDFAKALSITPEALSRIEHAQESLSASLDKLVRARLMLQLVMDHPRLVAQSFDIEQFTHLLDAKLPADDGRLALFLHYVGPYIGAEDPEVEFEFRAAA